MSHTRAAVAVAAVLFTGISLASPAAAASGPGACALDWGSLDRTVGAPAGPARLSTDIPGAALGMPRFGHHRCYDRIVYDVAGPVGSTHVRYQVYPDGGPTFLDIAVRHDSAQVSGAPAVALSTGLTTVPEYGYSSFSRQYQATSVRTRARLPYRVFVLKGPGASNRLVIDVAHRW